ncbi:MAG: antitoxin Xre/MbcA/ParS toxin-binding domain-containing protein [Cyanobacteriota bacterium]|nr:antitoxin Xre/MbcA/ParS toxin-binding domain-containing protein [Cyanobacteriota bacterium]
MPAASRSPEAARALDESVVLRKALQRAGEELGLSAQEVAQAVGKSRTFFETARAQTRIDPHTRQMIALVLRLHRSLSALVGDDISLMRHWIATANRHTGGCPRDQLQDPQQLVELVQYLDAMRSRP